jgi:single-stranded DNA-binding protein
MSVQATVIGNIVRIDWKASQRGPMATGAIASEHYSSQAKGNVTDFIGFVAFGDVADRMSAAKVGVGSGVFLTGELHMREPWAPEGKPPRSQAQVVVGGWGYLPTRREDAGGNGGKGRSALVSSGATGAGNKYDDDDIPF